VDRDDDPRVSRGVIADEHLLTLPFFDQRFHAASLSSERFSNPAGDGRTGLAYQAWRDLLDHVADAIAEAPIENKTMPR
jgi:hypothetical protein